MSVKQLLSLAASGNVDGFEALRATSGNSLSTDESSRLLLVAAERGHAPLVQILLSIGADLHARDPQRKTSAMLASAGGHNGVLSTLISKARLGGAGSLSSLVNAQKANEWGPLLYAAKSGNLDVVTVLLDSGAKIGTTTREGATALYIAAREGHSEVVKALAQCGCPVDACTRPGRTALLAAAAAGHSGTVSTLLSLGADPLHCDASGVSVYHEAACHTTDEVFAAAWDGTGDPSTRDAALRLTDATGKSPVHFAASTGSGETVNALLQRGWSVDSLDARNTTPLYYAVAKGNSQSVIALLQAGAHVDLARTEERTALHVGAAWGHADCCALLLVSLAEIPLMWLALDTSGSDAVKSVTGQVVTLLARSNLDASRKRALADALEAVDSSGSTVIETVVNSRAKQQSGASSGLPSHKLLVAGHGAAGHGPLASVAADGSVPAYTLESLIDCALAAAKA